MPITCLKILNSAIPVKIPLEMPKVSQKKGHDLGLFSSLMSLRTYFFLMCLKELGKLAMNQIFSHLGYKLSILLIRDMVAKGCNRRFGSETIHPTQKLTSMNLLQMSCVIT